MAAILVFLNYAVTSAWQWGPAFGVLGLGVLMGPLSMPALRQVQAHAQTCSPDARTE